MFLTFRYTFPYSLILKKSYLISSSFKYKVCCVCIISFSVYDCVGILVRLINALQIKFSVLLSIYITTIMSINYTIQCSSLCGDTPDVDKCSTHQTRCST